MRNRKVPPANNISRHHIKIYSKIFHLKMWLIQTVSNRRFQITVPLTSNFKHGSRQIPSALEGRGIVTKKRPTPFLTYCSPRTWPKPMLTSTHYIRITRTKRPVILQEWGRVNHNVPQWVLHITPTSMLDEFGRSEKTSMANAYYTHFLPFSVPVEKPFYPSAIRSSYSGDAWHICQHVLYDTACFWNGRWF